MARDFDLVLFGATGFTGRLVAEYLARSPERFTWALAGRSEAKLREVRAGLGEAGARVEVVVCDASDEPGLEALMRRTRVVCTTVGPYSRHGAPLARAAARSGTHYCDLTGEAHFVRRSIDENHAVARETGARLVHCCGFDSIPSDLGVLVLADRARELGESLEQTRFTLVKAKGGISGGTAASVLAILEDAAKDRSLRRFFFDPYSLSPDRAADLNLDGPDRARVGWDSMLGVWTGPFVMAAINARVVRRSNALLGFRYGRRFEYEEVQSFGPGPKGFALATAFTGGLGALVVAGQTAPLRALLARLVPQPGQGPSQEVRERGSFRISIRAKTSAGRTLTARVEGRGDPGYGATAKMLGESALALVAEEHASPEGGVLTPAVALGEGLVSRLSAAGMVFECG